MRQLEVKSEYEENMNRQTRTPIIDIKKYLVKQRNMVYFLNSLKKGIDSWVLEDFWKGKEVTLFIPSSGKKKIGKINLQRDDKTYNFIGVSGRYQINPSRVKISKDVIYGLLEDMDESNKKGKYVDIHGEIRRVELK